MLACLLDRPCLLQGYLAMDSVIISASSTDLQQQDRDQDQDQDQHASPDVVLSAHIVFSEVYSTPALFFLLTDSQSSKPLSRNMAQEFLGQVGQGRHLLYEREIKTRIHSISFTSISQYIRARGGVHVCIAIPALLTVYSLRNGLSFRTLSSTPVADSASRSLSSPWRSILFCDRCGSIFTRAGRGRSSPISRRLQPSRHHRPRPGCGSG